MATQLGKKICGVETDTVQLLTRLHQWHIERCAVNMEVTEEMSAKRPRRRFCGVAALEFEFC
jgi:hypothetical protein